jgi:hypothetical protein
MVGPDGGPPAAAALLQSRADGMSDGGGRRGTVRKMRQNLGWAIGYNSLALPIAAGVFEPWGLTLRPEIGALSMSGSSVLVAVNALSLKRFRLPTNVRDDRVERGSGRDVRAVMIRA